MTVAEVTAHVRGAMQKNWKKPMIDKEIENAIRVLLRTHMHLDHEGIPAIQMGAVPYEYDQDRYTKAWLLLWEKYGPTAKALLSKEPPTEASLVGTALVICEGCGKEINPDYGRCRRCG